MTAHHKTISLVIPVYNEAGNIDRFYAEVSAVFEGLRYVPEFLFVNDGSTDGSTEALERLAAADPRVKVLEFSRNFGKEAATSAGIAHAAGDAIIMIDADLQHPPALVPRMIAAWESGAEVVIGVRTKNADEGLVRRLGSRLFAYLMSHLGDAATAPGATDFRLIDRAVAVQFLQLSERERMTRALIDWLGFRREMLHFEAPHRLEDASHFRFGNLFRLAITTIVSHSLAPLRFVGYLGILITLLAGVLGLFILIEQPLLGDPLGLEVSGTAMLAVMILFLNGVVLTALGLMSLYIATIRNETVRRPLYVVRRTIGKVKSD